MLPSFIWVSPNLNPGKDDSETGFGMKIDSFKNDNRINHTLFQLLPCLIFDPNRMHVNLFIGMKKFFVNY